MLKFVHSWQMDKSLRSYTANVKSFSGATIDAMTDYANPTIKQNPDTIIIHAGTNELGKVKSTEEVANSIVELAISVKNKSKARNVILSEIIDRQDRGGHYSDVVKAVNKMLKQLCIAHNINLIEHSNILPEKHLNGSHLHLNKEGRN